MTTITTQEAKTHLSRYLTAVERGEQFIIARGKNAVAMLVPIQASLQNKLPKAGDIQGKPFEFPVSGLAPLTEAELKEWGL